MNRVGPFFIWLRTMLMTTRKTRTIKAADNPANIIAFDADVTIDAAEGDARGPRKFDVLAYTGGKLAVAGYEHPVVVDLAGLTTRKVVVANLDHNRAARVGHVTEKMNDGKQLRLKGVASAATPARDEVIASAADGFTWQASVEVAPKAKPVFVKAGKTVEVNGQEHEGPLFVARKSVLNGFAFLGQGADDNTSVRIAAEDSDSQKKGSDMDPKFVAWIVAMDLDVEELTAKQKAALQKKYDAEIVAAKKAANDDDEPEIEAEEFDLGAIRDAHRNLIDEIDAKLAEHEDDIRDKPALAKIKAGARETAKTMKQRAVKEKWTETKFEIEAIKAASAVELELVRAERPAGPAIHGSNRDLNSSVIEAALCQALKLPKIEDQFDEKTLQAAHTAFRGRLGLQQAIILAAASSGMTFAPGERLGEGNLKRALKRAFAEDNEIDAAFATVSLPGIFSNTANKELLMGYLEFDEVWREIATIKPVTDFKDVTSYRMLDNMEYEELGGDGRMKHGTIGEESYTRSAKTYAKMFALTRVDIINDDLGAFNDLRTRLGRGAKKKFNKVFWAEFLSNSSFFTSGRGNYITGATSTLLTDLVGLQLGVTAFDNLTTPTADGTKKLGTARGDRVGGEATMLLVPPELFVAADVIYKNANLGSGTANSAANTFSGKYRPVKVSQLSDANYTGYSATAWYLLRPKEDLAPMTVSFLNGVETPTVESADADFDQLGVQFRGYHDFGASQAEYLCGVKSKGAA